jgi:uncharacterized protein YceK
VRLLVQGCGKIQAKTSPQGGLTNQSTRIAKQRFYKGYAPTKKWGIEASIADPQSRDFKALYC